MFSQKEAGHIAAKALEVHVSPDQAREFRSTFEPLYSDLVAPSRGRSFSRSDDFASTNGRLLHVQNPKILAALAMAAESGDRQAQALLVEVIKDRHASPDHRMDGLTALAQFVPSAAANVALDLMHDEAVSHRLATALTRRSRSPELLPALAELAKRPDYMSHKEAMESLAEMGEAGSHVLADCMVSIHPQVRRSACNAVMMQKLETPAITNAIDEMGRHFRTPDDMHMAAEVKNWLRDHGFRWKFDDVASELLRNLDALDRAAPKSGWKVTNALRARVGGEGPEPGLLDWGRDKNVPLTRDERVAQSLVKLIVLRPELMLELAEGQMSEVGVVHRIGTLSCSGIQVTRAEQRDGRLLVPLARKLEENPDFRERVKALAGELSV